MLSYKVLLFTVILAITIDRISCGVLCRAAEDSKEDDGEVKQFFKNAGCSLEKGAKKTAEAAKSFGETVKEGAIKLGGNVKDKYHELKDKLSSSDATTPHPEDMDPYKPVPLAPFSDATVKCPEGTRLDSKGVCSSIL